MLVPFFDLSRQLVSLREDVLAELAKVWDSGVFALGPAVGQFEREFAECLGLKHAVACASGSDALLLALMALNIGPGDEVVVPSFTFFATASAVSRLGATPVFADIDPATYNLDPKDVASRITERTRAIIAVHLFGQCAPMDRLMATVQSRQIAVIEDAAQAIGAQWVGRPAGGMGLVGCFSFYPTKNLGGAGDGGMLSTACDTLAAKFRLLRVHGMHPRYYHRMIGINSRLDAFQAAVLRVKLRHLPQWEKQRAENARRYFDLFREFQLDHILGLPYVDPAAKHVWNQFVIRVPEGNRDLLRTHLTEAQIGTEIYYPLGLHEQECFAHLGYAPEDLPETYRATREVLALPIFPELTYEEQRLLVGQIARFYHGRAAVPVQHTRKAAA